MPREFKSLQEIKAVPGYVEKIHEGKHSLSKPLGYYRFEKKIHCALSTCNQPHKFGYVVVAASGAVVAVGNVCGQVLFGDAFVAAMESMAASIAHQTLVTEIEAKLRSLPEYKLRAESLLNHPRGALWLEGAEQSLRRACASRVLSSLYDRVANQAAVIEYTRERTKADPLPLMSESRKYITELLGTFRGLGGLRSPSPRSSLEKGILGPIATYMTQTPRSLADNKPLYQRFSQRHRQLIVHLNSAEARLSEAPKFFETSNLRLLAHVARNQVDRELLSRLKWNDLKGVVEIEARSASEGTRSA